MNNYTLLRKLLQLLEQSNATGTAVTVSTIALLVSTDISCLIAKNRKTRNIGENLQPPTAMKMFETIHGENVAKLLK
jgi:hypothetical protein